MKKRRKKRTEGISEELEDLIRVTPEETEEFRAKHMSYTITPRPQERPRGTKKKMWCCYCADWKTFKNSREASTTYPRCETCNISIEDFHIKKHNGLWENKKRKKDDSNE